MVLEVQGRTLDDLAGWPRTLLPVPTLWPVYEVTMNSEQLRKFAATIEKLRLDALFGEDGDDNAVLAPDAEQYYLLALGALDMAHRYAILAALAQKEA